MSNAAPIAGAVTMATMGVDVAGLLAQLDEVAQVEQLAADTYGSHARSLPDEAMQAKAEEFREGALRGREAAAGLMRLLGGRPGGVRRGLAAALARAGGQAAVGPAGRFGQLKDLQDLLVVAFLAAGEWAIVQGMAYGIGDPRLIQVAEAEARLKDLPLQWLLATVRERSSWAILVP